MLNPRTVSEALAKALPGSLKSQADTLSDIILNEIDDNNQSSSIGVKSQQMHKALKHLAGKRIEANTFSISFGADNQFGDITIRDIAGRDINNTSVTLHIEPIRRARIEIIAPALTIFFLAASYLLFQSDYKQIFPCSLLNQYELNKVVQLRGVITNRYWEQPASATQYEGVFRFIELDEPICVKSGSPNTGKDVKISVIQLLADKEMKNYTESVGRKVVATGALFRANTIYHQTDVLIDTEFIDLNE